MLNTKKIILASLLSLISITSFAEKLNIDSSHTFPLFEIKHFGLSTQRGNFKKTSGTIEIDENLKKGNVHIVIESDSINTGFILLEKHLKAEEYFDVANYPTIRFDSENFEFENNKLVKILGHLTMKGITKDVTLNIVEINKGIHHFAHKPVYGVEAITVIKRTDFNIAPKSEALSNDVTIHINLEAIAE